MNIRRKALGVLTAAAVAISTAGCTTTQLTNFLGQVQAAAAVACAFVPTVDTVLAVAASLGFSPAGAAAGAVNAVAAAICSKVPPPASARYKALAPQGLGPAQTIGTLPGSGNTVIPINGWRTH